MTQGVLRSKKPLEFSGTVTPVRVNKEEYERMMEERNGQDQFNWCGAMPDGPNMWKCGGECKYDEGAGMFPACMPFWHGDPNDPEYVYWCQCTTDIEWKRLQEAEEPLKVKT
jgi:hypothetical protein